MSFLIEMYKLFPKRVGRTTRPPPPPPPTPSTYDPALESVVIVKGNKMKEESVGIGAMHRTRNNLKRSRCLIMKVGAELQSELENLMLK